MPWVRVFTTWFLLPSMVGRSSSTPLTLTPCLAMPCAGLLEQMRGVQQRLGRDAADIEAGAAERAALLDAGHLEPELGRLDRGHVAARPAADDHQIVPRLAHDPTPPIGASRLPHPSGAADAGVTLRPLRHGRAAGA